LHTITIIDISSYDITMKKMFGFLLTNQADCLYEKPVSTLVIFDVQDK
jgi:hypothetical protein